MEKVRFFIASPIIGGHELQSLGLIKEIVGANSDYEIIVPNSKFYQFYYENNFPSEVIKINPRVFQKGIFIIQFLRFFLERRHFKTYTFGTNAKNYIVAGSIESSIKLGLVFNYLKSNACLYIPSINLRNTSWYGKIYQQMVFPSLKSYSEIITISNYQKRILKLWFSGPIQIRKNTYFVYAQPQRNLKKRIVMIGRVDQNKQVIEMIKELYLKSNVRINGLIIGDGPLLNKLKLLVSQNKLPVEVVGRVDKRNIPSILSKNDIILLNSLYEGEPSVILEARLMNLRVLVKKIPSVINITDSKEQFENYSELINKISQFD